MALSKFQLLLNNLSNELSERNLQSLIHICGDLIPGGQRDNIRSGWQVFTILLHQDAIGDGPEKLQLLLQIVRELKPKRKDLVSMVKRYIEENCEEAETILNEFEWSGKFSFRSLRPPTPILVDDRYSGCLFRTGCFNCGCTRCYCNCCCCSAFLAVFFILLTVTSVLVWCTDKIFPKAEEYSNTHHNFGRIVTSVFGFAAVLFFTLSVGCYCFQRHRGAASHTLLSDVDDTTSNQAVHESSYAASVGTRTSCGTFPRKMYRATSTGRMTASSSFASGTSYPAPIHPSNLEANGSLRQHNMFMFITEYEEDRESREEEASTADGCHASLGDTESLNQRIV
ncbi:uncharacterized protein LOC114958539 [Acropora millepora]|uniref:uncharacterized protein LOC114958539 n=1 Tax=Acropora millepora TaxID=45264 RepID=UPI001CF460F3|nr:uncharacterized protein LOC114958539 [Acropora millepora]